MKGSSEKQSQKLEAFIAAMLTSPTVEAAAKAAGISYVTAWRWMKDETFVARYRQARRDAMQHALALLEQAASGAVACLKQISSKGESESSRVSAARCILETALRVVEMNDIQERLDKLERIAKGGSFHEQPGSAPAGAARVFNGHAMKRGSRSSTTTFHPRAISFFFPITTASRRSPPQRKRFR